jgi:hypothetical protein
MHNASGRCIQSIGGSCPSSINYNQKELQRGHRNQRRHREERHESGIAWDDLPARTRKKLCYKAKRWLNSRAVDPMTAARLAERDGRGEVREWLAAIAAAAMKNTPVQAFAGAGVFV